MFHPQGEIGEYPMEKKNLILIGGSVIVVIVLIAVLATGQGSPVQKTGTGYGPVQPAGQGQGAGPGGGANGPVLLPMQDTTPLTATEANYILFMREEEQLAHDLYARWAGMYPMPVFTNIAASETMHIAEVQLLVDRYGLPADRIGDAATGYHDPVIRSLYGALERQGDASQTGALEAGLAIEVRDIADLDMAIANTTRADIIQVYANLRQGSENHRSAFLRGLGR